MVFTASYQSLVLLNPCYYCLRADYAIFLQLFCIFLKKGIDIIENRSKIFSRCRVIPSACIVWYSRGSVTAQKFHPHCTSVFTFAVLLKIVGCAYVSVPDGIIFGVDTID